MNKNNGRRMTGTVKSYYPCKKTGELHRHDRNTNVRFQFHKSDVQSASSWREPKMGDSVTFDVVGQEAKNVQFTEEIFEHNAVGTVQKYNEFTNKGIIRRNEMSKPDVVFEKRDLRDGVWSGGWSGWSGKSQGDFGWSRREATLIGRTVTFDVTVGQKAKNVRFD